MTEFVTNVALYGGMIAVVVPAISALINQVRLWRKPRGDLFVMHVDHQEFVFDMSSIDIDDTAHIEEARQAIRNAHRVTA